MRNLWLLPDEGQSGTILALEGTKIVPLHKAVELAMLPPSFTLGIPEEALIANQNNDFVFAQFARIQNYNSLFSCSIRAGQDKSGRSVVLTNFQILESGEDPSIPPLCNNLNTSPSVGGAMEKLISIISNEGDSTQKVKAMLDAVRRNPHLKSFSSERLSKCANKPAWMPQKKKY